MRSSGDFLHKRLRQASAAWTSCLSELQRRRVRSILWAASCAPLPRCSGPPVSAMGLDLPNPFGVAAGFDRDGSLVPLLEAWGFGWIEIGTVWREPHWPRAGGLAAVRRNLLDQPRRSARIGVTIGSPHPGLNEAAAEDFAALLAGVWPVADAVTLNLTAGRRDQAGAAELGRFLGEMRRRADHLAAETGKRRPLLVKMTAAGAAPPLPLRIACAEGMDGIVAAAAGPDAAEGLDSLCRACAPAAIISVGGIDSAAEAHCRLCSGAAVIQVYRSFVRHPSAWPPVSAIISDCAP